LHTLHLDGESARICANNPTVMIVIVRLITGDRGWQRDSRVKFGLSPFPSYSWLLNFHKQTRMGVGLKPLEFTDCLTDSPYFRENLHYHERELEKTSQQIKRLVKEVKDLLLAAKSKFMTRHFFFSTRTVETCVCCNSCCTYNLPPCVISKSRLLQYSFTIKWI